MQRPMFAYGHGATYSTPWNTYSQSDYYYPHGVHNGNMLSRLMYAYYSQFEPNERGSSMYSATSGGGSNSTASLCHHDYRASHLQQPLHIGIGVQSPQADHSLHTDINLMAPSPNSLTMYEHDQSGLHGSLSSCGSDDPLSPSLDFDLKPQFECNDDSLFKLDLACINSTFGNMSEAEQAIFKMEDVFQEEKSRDINQGPTLAALNFDNSVSAPELFDNDVESGMVGVASMLVQQYPATGQQEQLNVQQQPLNLNINSNKLWNSASLPIAFLTRPALRSFSSQTTPTKPTCTVSSPTSAAAQSVKDKSPNSFEVTGRFSLVPNASSLSGQTDGKLAQSSAATATSAAMVETKSALADLLTQNITPMAVGGGTVPVQVKAEVVYENQTCQHSAPVLTELKPVNRGVKRSISPDNGSNNSVGSVDRIWEEIKQFIHDDETPTFPTTNNEPLIKKIKTEPEDVAFNPMDDSDSDDEFDSDIDPNDLSDTESIGSGFVDDYSVSTKKEKRYFWQYNTQSKGPKGKRLCKSVTSIDPHILATFEDPVFDPDLNQSQYKHNGKARKGDGNDITPSPGKLFSIGKELRKLTRIINDITPPSELPSGVRPKTRKEKNKLASRACRLKKKAQHEANKVKLYGLEREHQKLVQVLEKMKWETSMRIQDPSRSIRGEKLTVKLDKLIKRYLTQMIAGNTTDYVNSVLAKVANGDRSGGLEK